VRSPTTPSVGGSFNANLSPYDLTRDGLLFNYFGHTNVKELALYLEDQIKAGNWLFNLGIRGDLYNGLAIARQAEPHLLYTPMSKCQGAIP
jgi:outer membrane receptor protein involved in Fe transport